MARIHELIRQVERINAGLAAELQIEADALASRRSFGLNFERHVPEAVDLPGRSIRRNDKVRILPPRGSVASADNDRVWRVASIEIVSTREVAHLESSDEQRESATSAIEDLVVVAEFRDPIYPGLVSTGRVVRGGNKPFHTVINSENYHALETLLFTHRGKADVIYIDPPYNTGARDWKYNNDYVESEDLYRHSKWLAFMERRLKLAKELLNPNNSALIVTIDEKEYLRLGLLLEQNFPDARIQMITTVIKPGGVSRDGYFGRSSEYIYFVLLGEAGPNSLGLGEEWGAPKQVQEGKDALYWNTLWRSGSSPQRQGHAETFYPIFIDTTTGQISEIGDPIGEGVERSLTIAPPGQITVWPIRNDGSEGRWQLGAPAARIAASKGYIRIGKITGEKTRLYYLARGEQNHIANGTILITGRREDNSVIGTFAEGTRNFIPTDSWNIPAHDATRHGSILLATLMPDRKFPFPKSLFAVEDTLRFFVADKPKAVIIDFFAGSGTTAHAVMRLNRQDKGTRTSICITNNEVSDDEQKELRSKNLRPGDSEWEQRGICDYITKPRIEAAITGVTPQGEPIKGEYKFNDKFAMSDGFAENVEFFTLTYEAPLRVESNREFTKIAPLLWMRAGTTGRRIENLSNGWDVAETYGVIANFDESEAFLEALTTAPNLKSVFIVTDEDRIFESMVRDLADHVEPVRLYESYFRNFEIDAARLMR